MPKRGIYFLFLSYILKDVSIELGGQLAGYEVLTYIKMAIDHLTKAQMVSLLPLLPSNSEELIS